MAVSIIEVVELIGCVRILYASEIYWGHGLQKASSFQLNNIAGCYLVQTLLLPKFLRLTIFLKYHLLILVWNTIQAMFGDLL